MKAIRCRQGLITRLVIRQWFSRALLWKNVPGDSRCHDQGVITSENTRSKTEIPAARTVPSRCFSGVGQIWMSSVSSYSPCSPGDKGTANESRCVIRVCIERARLLYDELCAAMIEYSEVMAATSCSAYENGPEGPSLNRKIKLLFYVLPIQPGPVVQCRITKPQPVPAQHWQSHLQDR